MMTIHTPKPIHFLLVEDDQAHADLVRLAFEDNQVTNTLTHVKDGVEAMAILHHKPGHEDAPRPDVVLLDLNLPKLSGHEVLERIKQDPALETIPVVILTTSSNDRDVARAYKHQANSYLTKPINFSQFQQMMKDLKLYWSIWNQPPPTG